MGIQWAEAGRCFKSQRLFIKDQSDGGYMCLLAPEGPRASTFLLDQLMLRIYSCNIEDWLTEEKPPLLENISGSW
jgi:hypothetical protein